MIPMRAQIPSILIFMYRVAAASALSTPFTAATVLRPDLAVQFLLTCNTPNRDLAQNPFPVQVNRPRLMQVKLNRPRNNGPDFRRFTKRVFSLIVLLDLLNTNIFPGPLKEPFKQFSLIHLRLDYLMRDLSAPNVPGHKVKLLMDHHCLFPCRVKDSFPFVDLSQASDDCSVAEPQGPVQVAGLDLGHQALVSFGQKAFLDFSDVREAGDVLVDCRVEGHVLAAHCEPLHVLFLAFDVDDERDAAGELLHELLEDADVQVHPFDHDAVPAVVVMLDDVDQVLVDLVALLHVPLDAALLVGEAFGVGELASFVGRAEEDRDLLARNHVPQDVPDGVSAQHAADAEPSRQQT